MDSNKIHTPLETWEDFWLWIKQQPEWNTFTREQRQYLDKTNRQLREGKVGIKRLKKTLSTYAPGRYEYSGGFIFHQ
jgi:hypothetical protein